MSDLPASLTQPWDKAVPAGQAARKNQFRSQYAMAAEPASIDGASAAPRALLDCDEPGPGRYRKLGLGLLDGTMLVVTFITADLLRCLFWQNSSWPQSPLNVYQDWYWYLWVLPALAVIWPVIVAALAIHGEASRRRRLARTLLAALVFFFAFSTIALFFSRQAYPRMQIILTAALAPLGFALGRMILSFVSRVSRWMENAGPPDYSVY